MDRISLSGSGYSEWKLVSWRVVYFNVEISHLLQFSFSFSHSTFFWIFKRSKKRDHVHHTICISTSEKFIYIQWKTICIILEIEFELDVVIFFVYFFLKKHPSINKVPSDFYSRWLVSIRFFCVWLLKKFSRYFICLFVCFFFNVVVVVVFLEKIWYEIDVTSLLVSWKYK